MQFNKYFAAIAVLGVMLPSAALADVTVTVDKYIDGAMATAGSATFPINATWQAANMNSGATTTGSYSLSSAGLNSATPFEAVTAPMTSGASYGVVENTPTTCDASNANAFVLQGYTAGDTLAAAAAATPSLTAPTLYNITGNKYVIVWNKRCLSVPTLVSPTDGYSQTAASWTPTWNAVSSPNTPVSYIYQISGSKATTTDGSFSSPLFTSGSVSGTSAATSSVNGAYYWHVQAVDAKGDKSPWSAINQVVINVPSAPNTVKVHVLKYLDGAQASASSANSYLFPMTSSAYAANISSATTTAAYSLGNSAGGASSQYGADSQAMNVGSNYATSEVTSDVNGSSNVLPAGAACVSGKYELQGYQVSSTSFADAATRAISTVAPAFYNLQNDQYVIVRNISCGGNGGSNNGGSNGNTGSIRGRVLQDNLSLFVRGFNGGSKGLSGWTVYLDGNNNSALDSGEQSATTDASGRYAFRNLPTGSYTVRIVPQTGYMLVSPSNNIYAISVGGGQTSDLNFDFVRGSTVSGTVFNDRNGNGRKNGNETGLSGWTVTLTAFGMTGSGSSASATTDANGNYSFANLAPGFYVVNEVPQTGWDQTSDAPIFVFVQPSQNSSGNDFGNQQPAAQNGHGRDWGWGWGLFSNSRDNFKYTASGAMSYPQEIEKMVKNTFKQTTKNNKHGR